MATRVHPTDRSAAGEAHADTDRIALSNGWSGISPPGRFDGRPLNWPSLPPAYGRPLAAWRDPT